MISTIPDSYTAWRHCITVICGLPLTPEYCRQRLKALENGSDPMTAKFVSLYGEQQLTQTIGWFQRALREAANS